MKYLLSILLLLYFPLLFAQSETDLKFDFFNSSTKLFVIGESHFEDDSDLQVALLNYLESNTDIDVFIIELSSEVGRLLNEYVLYGTGASDVNVIYSLLNKTVAKKVKILIDYIRNYNLLNTRKIQVRGIDKYVFHKLKRQMLGLLVLFPELNKVNLPLVTRYITSQKVKNLSKNKSARLIQNLLDEAVYHEEIYRKYLENRFDVYCEHLKDLEFHFTNDNYYSWRKSDSIREVFMSNNLINIIDSNSVSLMICGANHALMKENDIFPYGYPITSMVAKVKAKYPDEVFSIITQYYKKRIFKGTWEFNLLNAPMKSYFENNSVRYLIFKKKDIEKHSVAKERCDMIIIQNTQYKNKRQ